jgi:hypothetical protein
MSAKRIKIKCEDSERGEEEQPSRKRAREIIENEYDNVSSLEELQK